MPSKRLSGLTVLKLVVKVLKYIRADHINLMQDKQKVTLYLPPELHRELKIKAAVEADPMSAIAERAIAFYLHHSDVVDEVEASTFGSAHQVYSCPECESSVILRSKALVALSHSPSILSNDDLAVGAPPAEPLIPAAVS
jgi:hypothetical protein